MTAKRFVIFQDSYDDLYIQDKEVYRATGIKVGNEEDIKYENVLKIVELLNELHEELEPIKKICKKYRIPIKDLPEILEEYIAYDNDDDW